MEWNELTDSEKIIMKCVWDLGDGTRLAAVMARATDVYEKNWKSQTVSTFLGKLVRKGYVEQYREGRYYYYRIIIDKKSYRCHTLQREFEFWNDGDVEGFCDELMDARTLPAKKRRCLQKIISERKITD